MKRVRHYWGTFVSCYKEKISPIVARLKQYFFMFLYKYFYRYAFAWILVIIFSGFAFLKYAKDNGHYDYNEIAKEDRSPMDEFINFVDIFDNSGVILKKIHSFFSEHSTVDEIKYESTAIKEQKKIDHVIKGEEGEIISR